MTTLRDGVFAGLLLAAIEALVAVVTGHDLSPGYVVVLTFFDLAAGFIAAALAALVRAATTMRGNDFTRRFVPLGASLVAVHATHRVALAAAYRGLSSALAVAALLAGLAVVVAVARRGWPPARTAHPEASTLASLGLLSVALVGLGHWAPRAGRGSAFAAITGATLLVFASALFAQDRWLSHRRDDADLWARRWTATIVSCALTLSLGLSMRSAPDPAFSRPAPKGGPRQLRADVVLISVDTLRADRLSLYGYERDTTPTLRRLARESLVFTHALSPGTWTLPGHAAMLTGRFPAALGALTRDDTLPSEAVTLAEHLATAGYRTGAVVANASSLNGRLGWGQGFGLYSDEPRRLFGYEPSLNSVIRPFPRLSARLNTPWKTAEDVNARALDWLRAGTGSSFFLFINYMDTHDPYVPPDPWPDRYPGRLSFLIDPVPAILRGERDLTSAEAAHYRALYDGSVAYVDHQIGRLLEGIADMERLDNALVIVTSDHGEFLGEHRLFRHEIGPYEPVHRVPLLVRYPGGTRRGEHHNWVQLVDIMPTVLDVIGLPPGPPIDGEVLPDVKHPILIQQAPHPATERRHGRGLGRGYSGLYEGSGKLVAFDDGTLQLFDLEADRHETTDLARADVHRARLMQTRLAQVNGDHRRGRSSPPPPEALERLRAGGYVR